MRGAFIVIVLMSLLVVGYLVVQEMDTRTDDDGRVEEIERAREAAGQAEEAMDALRQTLKQED